MSTTRRTGTIIGLFCALLLAACGGGSAATSGPGGPVATSGGSATQAPGGGATRAPGGGDSVDACPLLTAADIEAVTGLATSSAEPGPQAGIFPSGCEYELVDEDAVVPPSIVLGVIRTGGKEYYETYFAPFSEENDYVAIEGLGDLAVDADFGSVLAVSGDTFFQVQYLGGGLGTGDEDTALAAELARKVVANLGG
jgi:hypothetical protein